MGESSEHKKARQIELQNAQLQQQIEKDNLARQNQIFGQVSPLAGGFINAGTNALNGVAPDYFQLGTRNALASAFGQQRQNLADFLGSSGQGFSGLAAGPAANLGAQESTAMGQAYNDALLQALSLGTQGSNILQGQEAIFNPQPYGSFAGSDFNAYTQATPVRGFGSSLLGSLTGAAIGAIPFGNVFRRIPGLGAPTQSNGGYGGQYGGG